jgi:hypothetical protein
MPRRKRVGKANDFPALYRQFLRELHVIYLNVAYGSKMYGSNAFAESVGALNIALGLSSSSWLQIR